MLYVILELIDGTIVKGKALELLKYRGSNNGGPCFILWEEYGSKMYESDYIKTISIWIES